MRIFIQRKLYILNSYKIYTILMFSKIKPFFQTIFIEHTRYTFIYKHKYEKYKSEYIQAIKSEKKIYLKIARPLFRFFTESFLVKMVGQIYWRFIGSIDGRFI